MNWWHHPDLLDRLAGAYTLGTLHGGARRRFAAVMAAHPVVAQAVARWAQDLQPLDAGLADAPADPALWRRIEGRLFGPATAPAAAAPLPWWQRWLGARPAAALALGLLGGVSLPTLLPLLQPPAVDATQLPESYVGVLATADGRPGLVLSSLRRGHTLDIKRLQPVQLPAGRRWVLWALDAQGRRSALATLPALDAPFTSITLPADAETLFAKAVELAISAEPADTALASLAAPSSPDAWRGLCGKLWRVPPAAATAAAPAAASR